MAKRAGVVSVDVDPNLSQVGSKIDAYARALKPFGISVDLKDNKFAQAIESSSASSRRSLDSITTTKPQAELRQLGTTGERELGRVDKASKMSAGSLLAIGGGSILAGSKILSALKPATDAASALNESVAYSKVVFGDSADAISKFGDTADQRLGQSKRAAIEGVTTFATFGKAAGLAGKDLVGFSTGLDKLAVDLASAKNTSTADAVTAISAALRGETEPIRNYGVLLDDATTRQEALALGIIKTTKDALTPQQRVLAVQSLLFKRTTDQQDDFARSSGSAATEAKKLNAQLENSKADAGQGLVGVLAAAEKAASGLLNVLGKIPGATTALGTTVAAIGALAIGGGAVSSILGAGKAIKELSAARTAATLAASGEVVAEGALVGIQGAGAGTATALAVGEGRAAVATGLAGAAAGEAAITTEALAVAQGKAATSSGLLATGMGKAVVGIGAAAVAYGAWSAAVNENNRGFDESISQLAIPAEKLQSALKAGGVELKGTSDALAKIIEGQNKVGPQSASDRINDFFGRFDQNDEMVNRLALTNAQFKVLRDTVAGLSKEDAAALFDNLRQSLIDTGGTAEQADSVIADLKTHLADTSSTDTAAGGIDNVTQSLDKFGFATDTAASKWDQYATSIGNIFDPIQAAMSAEDALAAGKQTLISAQKDLSDILAGNTDGVKSAAEGLRSARADLQKAVAETGPGSDAAQTALESLHGALRELHAAQVEAGKAPRAGDFFEDKRAAVADAEAKVAKAKRDLDKVNSGNSDQVISARDRVTQAQKRYNDELGKTGPHSDAAVAAQKRVNDAADALPGLYVNAQQAAAKLRDEYDKHPDAIRASITAIDEAAAHGQIPIAVAEKWKQKLLEVLGVATKIDDKLTATPPPLNGAGPLQPGQTRGSGMKKPQIPAEPTQRPPVGGVIPRTDLPQVSPVDGIRYGLPPEPKKDQEAVSPRFGPLGQPSPDGGMVKYRFDGKRWIPHFAEGGIREASGTVRRFEQGGIDDKFPTDPGIIPTTPLGKQKVVAFEAGAGKWEGYVPGDPAKRGKAIEVTREIAHRFGMELVDRKLERGPVRAFADGGFMGQAPTTPASVAPTPAPAPQVDPTALLAQLVAEVRALRGEHAATLRDLGRIMSGGQTESLAPILRSIDANTRNRGPGGFAAPTSGEATTGMRRAQAGLSR